MPIKKITVAITGANGFVGTALCQHFVKTGKNVVALVREPKEHKNTPDLQFRAYDLTKPVGPDTLEGVDYLIHAAFVKQTAGSGNAISINVDGTKRLLAAATNSKVKKIVFISSMSAHNSAESAYGLQKLQIEQLIDVRKDAIVRPGLIIGNGGIVKDMCGIMRQKHIVPIIKKGRQPLQIVYLSDLVKSIDIIISNNHSGKFTVATTKVYTYMEFYKALRKQLNTWVLFIPIPLNLLIFLLNLISWLGLKTGINKDNALGLKNLRAANTADSIKKLGISLTHLEDALDKAGI
jgi:nucleoside-diphosphate-sugar epimerase